ncbi:MAG: hypothetical protein ACLRIL_00035 [Fusicatenibacter saccharivorans]
MKKEESKVIAQKLQKIPNGTLALKHCRAGGTGTTLFGEQFRAVTAGKGCMEAYETFPGIEVSFNVFLASEVKFQHDASDSVLEIYYCRSGRVGWNMQGGTAVFEKLATTSSTGGLLLALQRAIVTARPKGRYRKHFCWPAIKRYYSNLLVSILLLALLYTFELLHLLYCQSFQHNIL